MYIWARLFRANYIWLDFKANLSKTLCYPLSMENKNLKNSKHYSSSNN